MGQTEISGGATIPAAAANRPARWFAGIATTGAVAAGLDAILYLASAIGWSLEGRSPSSGWVAIGSGFLVGAICGGVAIGVQRRLALPRIVAPAIALAITAVVAIIVSLLISPFDPNGGARFALAVAAPFAAIAVALATIIVTFTPSERWFRLGIAAATLAIVAMVVGLVATIQ